MASVSQRFVLVGPHAGKSMSVNGHDFVDGEFVTAGSAEQMAVLARVFSFYGAFTEDEVELRGLRAAAEASKAPAVPEASAAEALADALGLSLGEAIGSLDSEDDAHWTSNNLPSVDTLSAMVGKKVSRGDVEAIADGYTRAKARAAKQ